MLTTKKLTLVSMLPSINVISRSLFSSAKRTAIDSAKVPERLNCRCWWMLKLNHAVSQPEKNPLATSRTGSNAVSMISGR